jgi:hypothetical protein
MPEEDEHTPAATRRQIESLQNSELLAATHIGRLFEQREILMDALKATLAAHAKLSGHSVVCESCKAGRDALAEVQRLKQKYG